MEQGQSGTGAVEAGRAFVRVTADNTQLQAGLNRSSQSITEFGNKTRTTLRDVREQGFGRIGGALIGPGGLRDSVQALNLVSGTGALVGVFGPAGLLVGGLTLIIGKLAKAAEEAKKFKDQTEAIQKSSRAFFLKQQEESLQEAGRLPVRERRDALQKEIALNQSRVNEQKKTREFLEKQRRELANDPNAGSATRDRLERVNEGLNSTNRLLSTYSESLSRARKKLAELIAEEEKKAAAEAAKRPIGARIGPLLELGLTELAKQELGRQDIAKQLATGFALGVARAGIPGGNQPVEEIMETIRRTTSAGTFSSRGIGQMFGGGQRVEQDQLKALTKIEKNTRAVARFKP